MERLNARTVFPASVATPAYDREALTPGIVHIGVGAFHRAHQAIYTDLALEHAFGAWGITGVSLRSTDITHDLREQDYLHSVVTRDQSGDSIRVVGSTVGAIAASENGEKVLALLADPTTLIVTMTVSEKAYGIDPVSGGLDRNHPVIAADLRTPEQPAGIVGYLTESLRRRRDAGIAPFTVLCCDNLPSNGRVVRRLVLDMAAARDTALADWIAETATFPSSMVDRIVPAATEETRARAAAMLGAEDRLALETETFSQWVIEDDFVSGRPAWEAGGALFVRDVEPYEKMKLRLLNGAHSLIAYLGQLRGLEFVRDVMAVSDYVDIVRRHMRAAALTLDPVPGIDLDAYIDELIARFANPAIAHRTAQIAMDGSQKLPQRLFSATTDTLAVGRNGVEFAFAAAIWLAYLSRAADLNDPRAGELRAAAGQSDAGDPSAPFFDVSGLFPPELVGNRSWRDLVNVELVAERKRSR
jgi:fructuronate reductase